MREGKRLLYKNDRKERGKIILTASLVNSGQNWALEWLNLKKNNLSRIIRPTFTFYLTFLDMDANTDGVIVLPKEKNDIETFQKYRSLTESPEKCCSILEESQGILSKMIYILFLIAKSD